MRAFLLAAGILVATSAAAQDAACPGGDPELFAVAQSEHRAGHFYVALHYSNRLVRCFPDNVDFQFQRALALAALGRDEDALATARKAAALAPDYAEVAAFVERLEARIALARDREAAEAEAAAAEAAARAADAARMKAAARSADWTVTAFVSGHELSGGRDGWTDAAIELRRTNTEGVAIGGGIGYERRGNVSDVSLGADVLYPLMPGTRLTGRVGVTPGSAFRPGVLVAAGAEHDLEGGWVTRTEVAQRRFDGDRADNVTLGADYYIGAFRLAGAATVSRLSSAGSALGAVFSADWYASDVHRYRVTASIGDELDTIDESGTVLESRVRSLTFSGEHAMTPRFSLGWWLGTVEQGTFYDRRYAGFTVTRRY